MGPYAHKGDQWVGFDNVDIAVEKAFYVAEEGLGGKKDNFSLQT